MVVRVRYQRGLPDLGFHVMAPFSFASQVPRSPPRPCPVSLSQRHEEQRGPAEISSHPQTAVFPLPGLSPLALVAGADLAGDARTGTAPTGVALTRYTLVGEDVVEADLADDDLPEDVLDGEARAGDDLAGEARAGDILAGEAFYKQNRGHPSGWARDKGWGGQAAPEKTCVSKGRMKVHRACWPQLPDRDLQRWAEGSGPCAVGWGHLLRLCVLRRVKRRGCREAHSR